ncbi:hypothetical protein DKX38_026028 [Salix brachista]|uniref:Kinesin motor domain-containing protein n=1 Tax=Salix brachista TaxID=2182728 RepID=A0A5N5JR44_9ROSI|nr:hypothetical protein DKX38_026028 [Salix brachista]
MMNLYMYWQETQSLESICTQKLINPVENDTIEGRSMLGFSLTSPDLVICAGSPDISRTGNGDSPDFMDKNKCSIEVSLENGIDGSEFVEDDCFAGGDTVRTNATIGDGQEGGLSLYQTARYGNFTYCFRGLEPGTYDVSLHLAEIVFTEGPPGLRVFDVFIHEKKAVSSLDIYAQVVANKPLVVSDLKAFVEGDEDLLIRFEGVMGKPIVCGISVPKGPSSRNIRVFCRCRSLKPEEVTAGALVTIDFESAKDGELKVMSNGLPRKTFKFDAVFGPQANQADVFEDTASFSSSILDGYNVCVFAHGQTGTGKTFTMEEVYNEQIRDILVSDSQPGVAAKSFTEALKSWLLQLINKYNECRLEIRQAGEVLHHVPGLVEARVHNMSEVWEVLQTGSNARAICSTNANEHSSRSHCIHCVMVKGENLLNGECTRNKLWLVDLAGSERIAKTEVQGERLKETQNINKSLSALGDVISALATKSPHIPFRL